VRKLSLLTLLLSLLLIPLLAGATRLQGLFEAEVEATGRDNAARDAALRLALEELLVRLTGSRAALQTEAAASLTKEPGRLVEQFRFIEAPAGEEQPKQLRLWVQFDGVSLSRQLRQAGLPYWGAVRPDILAWLAIDDRGRRYLLSDSNEPSVAAMLTQAAQRRGLPLTLPLLDLEDRQAVKFTDVWGGFFGAVTAASERYRPQVILTARLARDAPDGEWRANWQLADGPHQQNWRTHAASLATVLDSGVADAGEWLAQRYAVVATQAGLRTLVVEGVRDLQDYARVLRYLASLSPVDRVDVLRVEDQDVAFKLALSADEHNLRQVITLGRVLQQTADPLAWRFRLNR